MDRPAEEGNVLCGNYGIHLSESFLQIRSRACLKNQDRKSTRQCFTIFHEMFFTNDLWMFDESTDYMIRMLPEGFFSDMVIRIVKVFVGSLAALGVVIGIIYKICDRHTAGKENVV